MSLDDFPLDDFPLRRNPGLGGLGKSWFAIMITPLNEHSTWTRGPGKGFVIVV